MIKPASLRRSLVAAIPSLDAEPEKLVVFIDHGSIIATGTRSLSFECQYSLHVLVMDFAGDADTVFVTLIEWARSNQPDLVTGSEREGGITFEVDILNHTTSDLSIKLALTERVAVTTEEDGKHSIEHVDDQQADTDNPLTWVALP